MNVLLSIKPKYVKEIIEGRKRYEFRRTIFKRNDVDGVFIYATSPIQKIVGKFTLSLVIEDHPEELWNRCKDYAGVDEKEFFSYFEGKNSGYAIKIREITEFVPSIDPQKIKSDFKPPQSFRYIENITNL